MSAPSPPASWPVPALTVEVDDAAPGACLLWADGEIDLASGPLLDEHLDRCLGSGRHVVLDLDGVRFLGSYGVRILLEAHLEADARGLRLVVTGAGSRVVSRILAISGADEVLDLRGGCPRAVLAGLPETDTPSH